MKLRLTSLAVASLFSAASAFAQSGAVNPEFVDRLLDAYFELQTDLSKDDLAAAQNSAEKLKTVLVDASPREQAPPLATMSDHADKIARASDLAVARAAFQPISQGLEQLIKTVGTSGEHDVYKMSCPMAFDNKGGAWLQNNKNLANPYFGSMMYRCGTLKGKLVESGKASHKGHGDHSGHSH